MCEKIKSYYILQLFNLIPEVMYSQKCHINTYAIPEIYKFIITLNIKKIRISEEVTA
jgi:hypothetical protein